MKATKSQCARLTFLFLASAVVAVGVGHAATTTGSLSVSGTVTAGACTVDNPTLSFGSFSFPLSAPGVLANSSISVNCPTGTQYAIDLGQGLHFSSSTRQLFLAGSGNIVYSL